MSDRPYIIGVFIGLFIMALSPVYHDLFWLWRFLIMGTVLLAGFYLSILATIKSKGK